MAGGKEGHSVIVVWDCARAQAAGTFLGVRGEALAFPGHGQGLAGWKGPWVCPVPPSGTSHMLSTKKLEEKIKLRSFLREKKKRSILLGWYKINAFAENKIY